MTGDDTQSAPVDEAVASKHIEGVLAAFNAHDLDGFVAHLAEDVVFEYSAAPATMHGRAEVRAYYANSWKAFPDMTVELLDGPFFHLHAPRISLNWRAVGTHTGPLDRLGLAPTGKRVEFDIREIVELRDGLTSRARTVIDMLSVMRQLGAVPASGSPASE